MVPGLLCGCSRAKARGSFFGCSCTWGGESTGGELIGGTSVSSSDAVSGVSLLGGWGMGVGGLSVTGWLLIRIGVSLNDGLSWLGVGASKLSIRFSRFIGLKGVNLRKC